MEQVIQQLDWSAWQPLNGCWRGTAIPALPGLYRIRRQVREDLDYIGQTGKGAMTLRDRLGMLRDIYGDQMPYRAPHTARPGLWALRQLDAQPFLVSVVPIHGLTPWRKGLECVAISLYRQEHQGSPTVNFGRMPLGYYISSSNDARLAAAGKRFRGGPTSEQNASHFPSIAPVGPLEDHPQSPTWCGHVWSEWISISEASHIISPAATGLYRLRERGQPGLLYIGQGLVQARLAAHVSKVGQPDHRQSPLFTDAMECSWVINSSWYPHQRLELENDLIAAYVLNSGTVPRAQFLG